MKEKIKLKDVAIHSKGKQINGSDLVEDGMYDYLNGGINPSGKWNEYNTNGCTVTISEGGNSSGYVNYMEEPFWCGAHCYFLSDVKGNPKYLYFALKSKQEQIMNLRTGATMPNIKKSVLGEFEFTYDSSLEEQNKVVSVLERIEKIISYKNEQLHDLDNLIKSRFVEMFGDLAVNPFNWKESQLIDLCSRKDDIKCGPFGTQLSKDEYKKDGVPLWGIPQINSFFTNMPTDYLSEDKAKKLEAYSIIKGDIVMSRKGNVGKCAIYPDDFPIGIMHSDALRIRINPKEINSKFLMHQLHNSRYVVNQIENVSSGAIMAGVNVTKLKTIVVHIPPIDLQNEFETFVKQVDNLQLEVQKSLRETQVLFDSLMQDYFE